MTGGAFHGSGSFGRDARDYRRVDRLLGRGLCFGNRLRFRDDLVVRAARRPARPPARG